MRPCVPRPGFGDSTPWLTRALPIGREDPSRPRAFLPALPRVRLSAHRPLRPSIQQRLLGRHQHLSGRHLAGRPRGGRRAQRAASTGTRHRRLPFDQWSSQMGTPRCLYNHRADPGHRLPRLCASNHSAACGLNGRSHLRFQRDRDRRESAALRRLCRVLRLRVDGHRVLRVAGAAAGRRKRPSLGGRPCLYLRRPVPRTARLRRAGDALPVLADMERRQTHRRDRIRPADPRACGGCALDTRIPVR